MKKILFVCALVFMSGMAFGQTKKCCASKKACTKSTASVVKADQPGTIVASALAEAELAAEEAGNIEKRVCSASGKVSFHEKAVCEKSGTVSYSEVNYDAASKTFVKAASVEADAERPMIRSLEEAPAPVSTKQCTKGEKKSCAKTCTGKKGA